MPFIHRIINHPGRSSPPRQALTDILRHALHALALCLCCAPVPHSSLYLHVLCHILYCLLFSCTRYFPTVRYAPSLETGPGAEDTASLVPGKGPLQWVLDRVFGESRWVTGHSRHRGRLGYKAYRTSCLCVCGLLCRISWRVYLRHTTAQIQLLSDMAPSLMQHPRLMLCCCLASGSSLAQLQTHPYWPP